MPDFNKGDFTQQGVAGHVNANLRLNEKRLVNIDLTSNEEAEGCTITGSVKDLLNDKVYNIGSGGGGGGDDYRKCVMSVVASEIGEDLMTMSFENGKWDFKLLPDNSTTEVTVLYYPDAYPTTEYEVRFWAGITLTHGISDESNVSDLVNLTVDGHYLVVTDPTQDCSLTISANEFYEM